MKSTVGTCGNCGGPVTVPTVWMGVIPPTPTCEHCGAIPAAAHGPVLPMQQPAKIRWAPTSTGPAND